MALTQISTQGIKDGTITGTDLATNVDLVDNQKLRLGNSQDLQIFHDGSQNIINGASGQNLEIQTNAFRVRNQADSESMIVANADSAVELYHDGSLKANTRSDGFEIKQHLTMGDSDEIRLGNSSDLKIYHDGTDTYINNRTGNLYLAPTTGVENGITVVPNGEVRLYHDNVKKFQTHPDGSEVLGHLLMTDNRIIKLGTSSDLQIYHDGSNSFIKDSGTGGLFIQGSGGGAGITLEDPDGNDFIKCIDEGTGGTVELYKAGSKKLETTSIGISVTGSVIATGNVNLGDSSNSNNNRFIAGASDDLQIFHDGSNSFVQHVGTGGLFIDSLNNSADLVFRSQDNINMFTNSASQSAIDCVGNGGVLLYHQGNKKFETTSDGITVFRTTSGDPILRIVNSSNATGNKAEIRLGPGSGLIGTQLICEAVEDFTSGANRSAKFTIQNRLNGTFEDTLVMSHTGQTTFKSSSNSGNHFRLFNETTSNTGTMFVMDSSRNSTNGSYKLAQWGSTTAARFQVLDSGTVQNGNGVYEQISDETLKENIVDADSQWNDIKNIKIRKFNFKESVDPEKTTMIGVIAQEVELVSPNLVSSDISMQGGEEKEYKSFKQSILYMKAVKCLQEAMAKIEVLETEVAALKAG